MSRPVASSFLLLLLSGCATAASNVTPEPVAPSPPSRVLAVNASALEIIEALGEGASLVRETPEGDARGLHPYRYTAEDVLAFAPDALVATGENVDEKRTEALRQAGVRVLVLSDSGGPVDTFAERVRAVGEFLGKQERAEALVADFEARLSAARKTSDAPPRVMFIYPRGPGNHLVYGRTTGVERLIEAAGGVNAMSGMESVVLTEEVVVRANPDVILVMNRALERLGGAEAVLDFPGVIDTNAGANGRIIAIDDTARWVGPRFPEFVRALAEDLRFTR